MILEPSGSISIVILSVLALLVLSCLAYLLYRFLTRDSIAGVQIQPEPENTERKLISEGVGNMVPNIDFETELGTLRTPKEKNVKLDKSLNIEEL